MPTPGMAASVARISRTYNSFSGVDIQAVFSGARIGELQGVSYTVTREKAPLYTMGSPDPRAFSRGKRGIAGSLIFLVFDRSNLLEALGDKANFWSDTMDGSFFKNRDTGGPGSAADWKSLSVSAGPNTGEVSQYTDGVVKRSRAWYHDQIPPFDIVLTALNEYGHIARMVIRGVEILNAGSGISIDDITTDENMTFVATDIIPWQSLGWQDPEAAKTFNIGQPSSFA